MPWRGLVRCERLLRLLPRKWCILDDNRGTTVVAILQKLCLRLGTRGGIQG